MKAFFKLFGFIIFLCFLIFPLSAKDSVGISFEFGAIGSEKKNSSVTMISGNSISIPYTETTFNPDIQVGINIPVIDITETCFFSFDLGYNFSWEYSYSSNSSSESQYQILSHRFSVQPQLTFIKPAFKFFIGTGFAFGKQSLLFEMISNNSYSKDNQNTSVFYWNCSTGLKYKFGNHLYGIADFTFFVNLYDEYDYKDTTSKSSGNAKFEINPKIGVMYLF